MVATTSTTVKLHHGESVNVSEPDSSQNQPLQLIYIQDMRSSTLRLIRVYVCKEYNVFSKQSEEKLKKCTCTIKGVTCVELGLNQVHFCRLNKPCANTPLSEFRCTLTSTVSLSPFWST